MRFQSVSPLSVLSPVTSLTSSWSSSSSLSRPQTVLLWPTLRAVRKGSRLVNCCQVLSAQSVGETPLLLKTARLSLSPQTPVLLSLS